MQLRQILLCSFALLLTGAAAGRAQVLETFENTSDITNNFNQTGGTGPYTNVSTPPTIGSNSVEETGASTETATYSAGSFTLAVGYQITASVYVAQQPSTSQSQVLVETGFGDSNSDVFHQSTNGYAIYSRLYSNSTSSSYSLLADNRYQSSVAASETNTNSAVTLTGSSATPIWYLFSVTLTNEGSGVFQETGNLQYVGSNGSATPGASVASFSELYSGSGANTGLAAAATTGLYSGFRSGISGGALRIDNFAISAATPAPEPASLGLLAVGGVLFMRRRK